LFSVGAIFGGGIVYFGLRYFQIPQVSGQRQRELERQLEWERGKRQEVKARLQRQGQVQPPVREPQSSGDVPLVSAVGVNYTKLRDLLVAKNWKEADLETEKRMREVAGKESQGYLNIKDMENFPCQDLGTIDILWVKYSYGKFGFSVQKQIYQDLGGTKDYDKKVWESFGDKVGWRKGGSWLSYSDLNFEDNHYMGHLPACEIFKGRGRRGYSFLSRAETCNI
jgi:serine/threonine-protein kinase